MLYILHWLSFFIFSSVAIGITSLSIITAFDTQHFFILILKVFVFIFILRQLFFEGKGLLALKDSFEKVHVNFKEDTFITVSVVSGCLITYVIANQLGINSVFVAGLVGVIANLLFKTYQIPIYCGSFAGMASSLVFNDIRLILISAICTALLFVSSQQIFKGFGGKLGATAFFGTFITVLLTNRYHATYKSIEVNFQFEIIICFILGAILTHQLHLITKRSTVLTSGILGVIAGIILPIIFPDNGLLLAAALFSGAFLGMTSKIRFEKSYYFLVASTLGGIIFIYSQPYFNGLGGKLGAIAFISSIAMTGLRGLINQYTGMDLSSYKVFKNKERDI